MILTLLILNACLLVYATAWFWRAKGRQFEKFYVLFFAAHAAMILVAAFHHYGLLGFDRFFSSARLYIIGLLGFPMIVLGHMYSIHRITKAYDQAKAINDQVAAKQKPQRSQQAN